MAKSNDKPHCVNKIGTFKSEEAIHGRTSARCKPSEQQSSISAYPSNPLAWLIYKLCQTGIWGGFKE